MSEATRDDKRTPLALGLAVGLHLLVAAVLVFYFWKARAPMMAASEHVFELVASPTPDNAPASAGAPAAAIQMPTLPKITPLVTQPPKPVSTPPTPPKIAQTTPPPKPVPTTSAPSTISYDQFVKNNPLPKTSTTATRPTTARPMPAVGIDDTQIQKDLLKIGTAAGTSTTPGHTGQPTSGMKSDYLAGLKARLLAAYENPAQLVDPNLKAEVEITITADGRVIARRLTATSGNAAFDAAVQEALERVTMVDPPPGGQQTFTFTFKNVNQ